MPKIGVVSDTHGQLWRLEQAAQAFTRLDVETILHCGDIGSRAVPALLAAWPCHFVLGNVDWNTDELFDAIQHAGHTLHGRFASLRIGGRSIAMLHGDEPGQLQETVQSNDWDVVCFGHSHRAEKFMAGQTLVLNPGALHRALRYTVAVLDLVQLEVTWIELE